MIYNFSKQEEYAKNSLRRNGLDLQTPFVPQGGTSRGAVAVELKCEPVEFKKGIKTTIKLPGTLKVTRNMVLLFPHEDLMEYATHVPNHKPILLPGYEGSPEITFTPSKNGTVEFSLVAVLAVPGINN